MALNYLSSCRYSIFQRNSPIIFVRYIFTTKKSFASTVDSGSSLIDVKQSGREHAAGKVVKISKAMQAYMKAAVAKEKQRIKDIHEYELGKRHLANMMSLDPVTMTQQDVEEAIAYLLPSNLFYKAGRPKMNKPEKMDKTEAPQFAPSGRPFDDLFYTTKPTLYQTLYIIQEKIEKLIHYEMSQVAKGILQPPEVLDLPAGTWRKEIPGRQFSPNIKVYEADLEKIDKAMDYLVSLPYWYLEKDFVFTMRETLQEALEKEAVFVDQYDIISPVYVDEKTGREYSTGIGNRKNTTANVKVYRNGTGKITVNGWSLCEMDCFQSRELLISPFLIINRFYEFDVESTTEWRLKPNVRIERDRFLGVNETAECAATRLAMCRALRTFITEEESEKLRLAGYLSRDPRRRERNKFSHYGARKRRKYKRR